MNEHDIGFIIVASVVGASLGYIVLAIGAVLVQAWFRKGVEEHDDEESD